MDKLEKRIILIAGSVLLAMVILLVYSIFALGIRLPGCATTTSAFTKGELIKKSETLSELHVVAKMWSFEPQVIKIKLHTTLDIFLTSIDVNHGFHIENTNVNLMAVPGAINYARVTFREPGVYHVLCHEYCGAGHQGMAGAIIVGDENDQAQLLTQLDQSVHRNQLPTADNPGKTLFTAKGCVACHSIDGIKGVGPTFQGLYGRKEKMSDGKVILVDDAYITESIKDPAAKIVFGFQPAMPKLEVSDEEIAQIISFIKTLKPAGTAMAPKEE